MSDRYNSLTVVLEEEMRIEDVEPIINAIKMIKGVINVECEVANSESYVAKEMAKCDLIKKIYEALNA